MGLFWAALLCLLAVVLTACGANTEGGRASGSGPPTDVSGKVTVFAAASLTGAFIELAATFEREHPSVRVEFNFAGSPTLRTQLEQGARADAFASADAQQMELARQRGLVAEAPRAFASNSLLVITPKSNPGRVASMADLKRPGLKLVLANEEVPAGAYSREMLSAMDRDPEYGAGFSQAVLRNVVSLESNVKQVVTKVELGEADAGIVYSTDVTPALASNLATLEVPPRFNIVAEYPIAVTREARNPQGARAFIDHVLSPEGQAVLHKHGFQSVS